jgi:transcriptional regulator with XRE-family HTH domain
MIRAWEKMGLAHPSRSHSSYRLYTRDDLKLLQRAVYLRRVLGLNAPAILNQLRQEGLLPRNPAEKPMNPSAAGPRLRALRLNRGESLASVARVIDVSVGFLSNLERSQSGASVAVLHKLARYYGLNIHDLFSPAEAPKSLVGEEDRRILQGGEGVQMELLAWGRIAMEPHLFRVAPGAGSGEEYYSHQGEEFLFLTAGELTIWLDRDAFHLRSGDSFYFESRTPHRWHNPGNSETVILWINTPPSF